MPRSNIPYRSMKYFSNRKNTRFSRPHLRASIDTQFTEGQQGLENNIIVFPKYSESTRNIVSNNSKTLPFGNLLKKIKGRKRKEKQRLKKKQILEGDVKPVIKKLKTKKSGNMKPNQNQHIIFLSDSETENEEQDNRGKDNISETANKENCEDEDDDVIFIEAPPAEIIEIDDSGEQPVGADTNSALETSNERVSSPDDFLDNAHVNLKSKFDTEPHGSGYNATKFLKPTAAPVDMSESGSVSSISDISATVGMNVFKLIEFPQEKPNLFDDDNLEKFRDAITPKRSNKKQRDESNDKEADSSVRREKNQDKNLPTLSTIQVENDPRKQRGRSIIKELVNDRAYVLLSQKKSKNKKRKSRDEVSDNAEEETGNDSSESTKKKKKKKNKKKETNIEEDNSPSRIDVGDNEINGKNKDLNEDDAVGTSITIRTDLFEANVKKTKKIKHKDSEPSGDEEIRKKKSKKHTGEVSDDATKKNGDLEDTQEKRKKKNKKVIEVEENVEGTIQESNDEKKKKKTRKTLEESVVEPLEVEEPIMVINEESKKKKSRRTSEISEQQNMSLEISDNIEEKRKKKSKRNLVPSETVCENTVQIDVKEEDSTGDPTPEQVKDARESNEDKKKRKSKKNAEVPQSIVLDDCDNVIQIHKTESENKIAKESEIIPKEKAEVTTRNADKNNEENQNIPEEQLVDKQDFIKVESDESSASKEMGNDVIQNSDTQQDNQERNRMNNKRATELDENDAKKPRLELPIIEEATHKKVTTETKHGEVEKQTVSEVEKQTVSEVEIMANKETVSLVDVTSDCNRKRKIETSISEPTIISNEIKKIKFLENNLVEVIVEVPQIESPDYLEKRKPAVENEKETDPKKKDGNQRIETPETTQSINNTIYTVKDNSEKEAIQDNRVIDSFVIGSVEKELEVSKPETSIVVTDNEGNIDMKLTGVFSTEKSIFPNFVNDVEVNNFVDQNTLDQNTSWNANPSRFCSYNDSLFNETSRQDSSPKNNCDLGEELSLLPKPDLQTKLPESVEKLEVSTLSIINLDDSVTVKSEKNECESENIVDDSSRCEISVKTEADDVGVTNTNQLIIPSKNRELPNEIEEIVKGKDNHDTVKRLCEFLEEVGDPSDILKKVSLLKQAFTDKSQGSVVSTQQVQISYDNDDDDILSVSSEGSSVLFIEDDVSVISIEDDITLANVEETIIESGKVDRTLVSSTNVDDRESDDVEIVQSTPRKRDNVAIVDTAPRQSEDVQIIESTCKRSGRVETPKGAHRRGSRIAVIQSTPKRSECLVPAVNSSQSATNFVVREIENRKGLDKYEVEDIQASMSNNPRLWKIVAEDIFPVKLPTKGKRCINCKELGHLNYSCPNRFKLPKCSLCGMEGHLDFRCPNKICIQCGRKTSMMQNCCDQCKHYQRILCASCGMKGHPKSKCPDMWRRYHLTLDHGPLVQGSTLTLKDKKFLWCSWCAKCGHVESDCDNPRRRSANYQPFDPRIHLYEDIYKVKPTSSGQDFVQPNLDEIPQNTQNFLRDDTSSSASSSGSSNDAAQTVPNPSSEPPNDLDQSTQSVDEGLLGLTPDFEVIDEVNGDNQNFVSNLGNKEKLDFFMTASKEEIKAFLTMEVRILDTSKFAINHAHHRFFAFVEDDKKPPCKQRFTKDQKQKFYKSVNMMLFGKLQVKCGKVHTDKLKHFVASSPTSLSHVENLTKDIRYSLCYSYDYIFKSMPHDHVNYKFFFKMMRQRYGNQKWLY